MAATIRHATTVATPDDGSEVGSNAWNAAHTVAGSTVPYGAAWSGSTDIPSHDAIYDKIETIVGRTALTQDTTYYVRSAAANVTLSVASPCVCSWSGHGLSIGDAVIFHTPEDMFGNVAISNASPAVVTFTNHGLVASDTFHFETSRGALPTGVTANTKYYVLSTGLTANTFQFSASDGGAAVNSSSAGDGVHYCFRNATLPTGVTAGTIYYVISAGFGANSFQFSATLAGAAVNTSGSTEGKITATTGSDSNNGSAATRAGAFLHPQAAYDYIVTNIDTAGFTVTIQLASSTYTPITGSANIYMDIPWVGDGPMIVTGDATHPSNTKLSPGNRDGIYVQNMLQAPLHIESMEITTTGFNDCIGGEAPCKVYITNMVFGASDWQMAARANTTFQLERRSGLTNGLGTSPSNSELYNVMIRGGTTPGGCLQAANNSTIVINDPTIMLNTVSHNLLGFAHNCGVITLDGGGFFHGAFTGTIYSTYGNGRILSSISFGTPYMQVNRPRPTTQAKVRSAGGTYDSIGDPHFHAHKNSTAQSITTSTATKIDFTVETFDEVNLWNSTDSTLRQNVYGYYDYYYYTDYQSPMYYIEAALHTTAFGTNTTNIKLHLYKDNTLFRTLAQTNIPTGLTDVTVRGATIFRSSWHGVFDVRAEFTGLTGGAAVIDGSSTATWVAGYRSAG
jgi:hypothetical protein